MHMCYFNFGTRFLQNKKNTKMRHFFNKYALIFLGTPFFPKKNPRRARTRASKMGWYYQNMLKRIWAQGPWGP